MREWLYGAMETLQFREDSPTNGLSGDQIISQMLEAYQALQVTTRIMGMAATIQESIARAEAEWGEESDPEDDPMVDDDGWPASVDGPANWRR